jgi:hypothetical protein
MKWPTERADIVGTRRAGLLTCYSDISVQTGHSVSSSKPMTINHFRRGLVIAGILGFLVMPFVASVAHAADVTVFAARLRKRTQSRGRPLSLTLGW